MFHILGNTDHDSSRVITSFTLGQSTIKTLCLKFNDGTRHFLTWLRGRVPEFRPDFWSGDIDE
jgi:hypothetical protein